MGEGQQGLVGGITKGHKETFGGDGYVRFHGYGGGFTAYSYVKIYQIVQFKYVWQIYHDW